MIRRLAALIALLALVVSVVVVATLALSNLVNILIASLGLAVAIVGAWYSLSHHGTVRLLALAAVVAGVAIVVAVFVAGDARLWPLVAVAVVAAISVGGGRRRAARAPSRSPLRRGAPRPSASPPGAADEPEVGRWQGGEVRPGAWSAATAASSRSCSHRATICCGSPRTPWRVAPTLIGMAGGDGSQALVGAVASAHGIPHVVIPAGTRNHFALDLGIDRDDVVGALDAYATASTARSTSQR